MMRPIIVVDLTSTSRGLTLIFIKHIWLLRRMEFLLEEPLKCITFQNQLCTTELVIVYSLVLQVAPRAT